MSAIPQLLEELTPEWLTVALCDAAPGVVVDDIDVVRATDATNDNATVRVHHDAPGLPTTFFLKIPPVDPERRRRLNWASMGEREVRFYRDLAARTEFRVPQAFVAELDSMSGEFLLLLEHVDQGDCALADPVLGVAPDLVEAALGRFATLHARFEHAAARRSLVPWLQASDRSSDYGARLLRQGIDEGVALSAAFVDVAETYIANRDRLQDAWELGPTTVLHGDAHIGNVFVDRSVDDDGRAGELGVFDWGLMTVGSAMRDVSYLLTMTLDPSVRATHERELLDAYLAFRRQAGAAEISRADAWRWHRLQSGYTVVASCQAIAVPDDAGERRSVFARAFVERAERAVEDLDPLDALASLA